MSETVLLNGIVDFIRTVGVPTAICFYVLIRLEKKVDKLIEVVERGLARLS